MIDWKRRAEKLIEEAMNSTHDPDEMARLAFDRLPKEGQDALASAELANCFQCLQAAGIPLEQIDKMPPDILDRYIRVYLSEVEHQLD